MAALDSDTLLAVARRALDEWDIEPGEIELANQSENTVFRVEEPDGNKFALRIHRPGYHDRAELDSEIVWTSALREADISVPVPVLTRDGQGYASVDVPGTSETRDVGMLEWIEGRTLGGLLETDGDERTVSGHFESLGQIAAHIHNQASAWKIPKGFMRHSLDMAGFVGDAPFWGPFWNLTELSQSERELVVRARRAIQEILSDYGTSRQLYSMIHADLHPYNLMVSDGRLIVIDFDDAGFGWHQYELAVAVYNYLDSPLYNLVVDAMMRGYRDIRPMSDAALEKLPLFILVRSLALLGWAHDRPEFGDVERMPRLIKRACELSEAFLSDRD